MERQTQQPEERSPLVRRYNVERSCIRCHERKVRCNKATPCSACLRAKIPCHYPSPVRAKRRSHRHAASDSNLTPRLERLERLVSKLPKEGSQSTDLNRIIKSRPRRVSGPSSRPAHDTQDNRDASLKSRSREGLLLKDGDSTRYINEMLFSSVLEKVSRHETNRNITFERTTILNYTSQESELQSAIETPGGTPESRSATFGFDGLISNPFESTTNVSSLLPCPRQAILLWQSYLNNVNPLIRVLHIPTVEPVIFSAINDANRTPPDVMTLLFSIYFAAVTSLGSPETEIILGHSRQSALRTYQRGLEVSLHMASFLDSPTIQSLQALSIYQVNLNLQFELLCGLVC